MDQNYEYEYPGDLVIDEGESEDDCDDDGPKSPVIEKVWSLVPEFELIPIIAKIWSMAQNQEQTEEQEHCEGPEALRKWLDEPLRTGDKNIVPKSSFVPSKENVFIGPRVLKLLDLKPEKFEAHEIEKDLVSVPMNLICPFEPILRLAPLDSRIVELLLRTKLKAEEQENATENVSEEEEPMEVENLVPLEAFELESDPIFSQELDKFIDTYLNSDFDEDYYENLITVEFIDSDDNSPITIELSDSDEDDDVKFIPHSFSTALPSPERDNDMDVLDVHVDPRDTIPLPCDF